MGWEWMDCVGGCVCFLNEEGERLTSGNLRTVRAREARHGFVSGYVDWRGKELVFALTLRDGECERDEHVERVRRRMRRGADKRNHSLDFKLRLRLLFHLFI